MSERQNPLEPTMSLAVLYSSSCSPPAPGPWGSSRSGNEGQRVVSERCIPPEPRRTWRGSGGKQEQR